MMQNKPSFMFFRTDLDTLLGENTVLKGEDYQKKDWVKKLKINQDAQEITSEVQGVAEALYHTRIKLVTTKHKLNIEGYCSCYVNYNCKHVAATLLEVLSQVPAFVEEPKVSDIQTLQSRFLSSPPATLTPTSSVNAHWLSFLDTMKKKVKPSLLKEEEPKQVLLYVFDTVSIANGGLFLQVSLKCVNRLKKGGYGAEKPYLISSLAMPLLKPEDTAIIDKLNSMKRALWPLNAYSDTQPIIVGPLAREIVASIINTHRACWKKISAPKLTLGPLLKASFEWELLGDGLQQLRCKLPNKTILSSQPLWYLDNNIENGTVQMGPVETEFDEETAFQFINTPAFTLEDAKLFYDTFPSLKKQINLEAFKKLPAPKSFISQLTKGVPVPVLSLAPHQLSTIDSLAKETHQESALAILSFEYEGARVDVNNQARTLEYYKNDILMSVERDLEAESLYLNILSNMKVKASDDLNLAGVFSIEVPFMFHDLPTLREKNWIIDIDEAFPFQCVEEEVWYTNIEEQSEYDWFGFELGILIEGKKINVLPLLVNLIEKNPEVLNLKALQSLEDEHPFYLQLPDERYIEVLAGRIKNILSVLVELYDKSSLHNGIMKIRLVQAGQLLGLQQSLQARWLGGDKLKNLGEKLTDFEGIQPCVLPKGLKGQLRAYQKEGLDWLNFLRELQLGGILADDMGLGKTIQVLTLLLAEKESGRQKGPNLIVAPTSLMANWENECNRFTPDLKVLILQGMHRQAQFEHIQSADLVLTTYPLINRDKSIFLDHTFHYLILDEAQYIKNPYTKAYQALLEIKANHTLCMTGTPMENHLGELWALFHFAVPGLLGDNRKFKKLFRDPIEREGNVVRQKSLAQRLKPFMLRRTKEQVATELPAKTEIVHRIELSGPQLDLYESIRLAMQEKIRHVVKEKGLMRSQILILDALLKLRQTCNDPRLLSFEKAKAIHHSAKREFLMEMLTTLIEEGRRILLFSSFATMLDLLELELIEKNIPYVKLTGQTIDRATVINRFQEGNIPVMLISLKAGGVGLNLTAADTVIHYDPWWNPAAEAQATDRAHRLGQTKPVFVYKLVCKGTVEEKILKMQENKKALLKGVFKPGANQSPTLSAKDVAYLLEPMLE